MRTPVTNKDGAGRTSRRVNMEGQPDEHVSIGSDIRSRNCPACDRPGTAAFHEVRGFPRTPDGTLESRSQALMALLGLHEFCVPASVLLPLNREPVAFHGSQGVPQLSVSRPTTRRLLGDLDLLGLEPVDHLAVEVARR